ncbi:MAG TPA: methyltransferase domain-containing protein [Erysipelotrichaceae bacterium]|jgi:phosphatidylethanolamine/phosphatidyl-N-methylethanolamine N-methyltransferase|nr:methyltransferase domain-containing protein [Erysipelotrichaceae bacterium]HQA85518.1 methyltransferase domain-containing protein [Erysipelotrichaceae bacterium]
MRNEKFFWDYVSSIYDVFVYVINFKTHNNLKKQISSLFKPNDFVLECACGTGMFTKMIASQGSKLIATDFSEKMVQKAEINCKAYKNVHFKIADISKLEFEDNSFDKVVAGNVIHLLEEPKKALEELIRVCKPRCKIIVTTYINEKENVFTKILGKFGADSNFKRKFTFSSYEQFFTDLGCRNVRYIKVDGFIPCSIAIIEKPE